MGPTLCWTLFIIILVYVGKLLAFVDNFHIAAIGRDSGTQLQSDWGIDCRVTASLNFTLNATTLLAEPGNAFELYNGIHDLLQDAPIFVFVDQSVLSIEVLKVIIESSPHKEYTTFFTMQKYVDTPSDWCCLIDHYATRFIQGYANVSEIKSFQPTNIDIIALDEWSSWVKKRARVLLDLAHRLKWKQFLILYEKEFEDQVRELTDLSSTDMIKTRLSLTGDPYVLQQNILQYFEDSDQFQTVLITTFATAQEVLKLCKALEAKIGKRISVTQRSNWVLFSQRGEVKTDSWMFTSQFDNIVVISDPSDTVQDYYGQADAHHHTMLEVSTLLYKTKRRELSSVGYFDHNWTLKLNSDVFPNIKFGFNGRIFNVTTSTWTPYVLRQEINGTIGYTGFCIDLLKELSRTLNFTYYIAEPPDGLWGAEEPDGTWNGMVGQVIRQEVDMIVAPIGVTVARERVIDFTFPFFYDDSAVIMKKPDPEKSKWRTYIDIFRKEVLMSIAAALVLGALIIMMVERTERIIHRKDNEVFATSYGGSFWYLLGAMLNQGGRNLPTSVAGRVFLSFWWLFCLVVAGTYSGNLIAVLTVSKDKPPFSTLAEMADQDDYKFGTLDNSMWSTLFETSPRPEFQAIHRKMQSYAANDPNWMSSDPDYHLRKVKRGGYAYIADKGLFLNWLAYNCDLMLLKENFFPGKYAIGLLNNSVYTKLFSDQVVKIYESGLLQVWVKKWWPKQSFCGGSLITEAKTLNLVDVQSTFYLIGLGFAIAGLILSVEILCYKLRSVRLLKVWTVVRKQT